MKYLYELAFKYLDNQSKVNDTSFINNYFKSCSYLTKSERQNIAIVNSSLIKFGYYKNKFIHHRIMN